MLPVSLDCPFLIDPSVFSNLCPVSCVPNVTSVSGLTFGTQDTGQRLEKPEGSIKNGQSRDTGSIWYTRNRTKVRENRRINQERTIQRHW
jgi:hypothetical protein